jgi:hypothetical protein
LARPGNQRWNGKWAGKRAGTLDAAGYRRIEIHGRSYREHRIAHLMVLGVRPTDQIDHRNRDRADNRWQVLRLASHGQNTANRPAQSNNRSGTKGVDRNRGKWRARIKHNGKKRFLGRFTHIEAAAAVYAQAATELHGAFARLQ